MSALISKQIHYQFQIFWRTFKLHHFELDVSSDLEADSLSVSDILANI